MKKIVFISGHIFGYEALRGLVFSEEYSNKEFEISLLITLSENNKVETIGYFNFKKFAFLNNINHKEIVKYNNDFYDLVYEVDPDFIICIGWSKLLRTKIIDIPKQKYNGTERHTDNYGCIGMHPTLLPIGRGRAPIPWTIIKELPKTGLTTFFLEEEPDSGDIILQTPFSVNTEDTSTSLFETFTKLHFLHGNRLADLISSEKIKQISIPQNKSLVTKWKKRTYLDSKVDFNLNGKQIIQFFKAMTTPYPIPFIEIKQKVFEIKHVVFVPTVHKLGIGTIIKTDIINNRMRIAVIDGYVDFFLIQEIS